MYGPGCRVEGYSLGRGAFRVCSIFWVHKHDMFSYGDDIFSNLYWTLSLSLSFCIYIYIHVYYTASLLGGRGLTIRGGDVYGSSFVSFAIYSVPGAIARSCMGFMSM